MAGFIECHGKVRLEFLERPSRCDSSLFAVNYRDLLGLWHIDKDAGPVALHLKRFRMTCELDVADFVPLLWINDNQSAVAVADIDKARSWVQARVVSIVERPDALDLLKRESVKDSQRAALTA